MGCMMPSVQGLRENRTEEGAPHVVEVHAEWGVVEGMAANTRWRRNPNSRQLPPRRESPLQSRNASIAATTICSLSMAS